MTKPIISHSESDAMTLCELKHYYSYGERLASKTISKALDNGITGHGILEVFFKSLQETSNWDAATAAMDKHLMGLLSPESMAKLVYLKANIDGWLEHYKEKILSWKIISVEQEYRLETPDFTYAFKLDLLVEEGGEIVVVDYKFVGDFYSDLMCQLMPQIPRYIGALRGLGIRASRGYYAFLRTRVVKNEGEGNRYMFYPINPNHTRIVKSFKEIIKSSKRIQEMRDMGLEAWHEDASRAGNKLICNYCSFQALCVEELNGGDGKYTRLLNYQPSTYGYVQNEE